MYVYRHAIINVSQKLDQPVAIRVVEHTFSRRTNQKAYLILRCFNTLLTQRVYT